MMTEYVYRWSCQMCTTSFIMYIDRDPKSCPNCGRALYEKGENAEYHLINELEIESKVLE